MIKKLLTLMMSAMVISAAVQVPSMAASKTVVVTVAATDNTVVAAAYSADGELLCCKTFTPSGTGSDRVVLSADRDIDRVKVFEWDGTGGMRPAGRSVSYPV